MNPDKNNSLTINITTGTFVRVFLLAILVVFLYFIRDLVAVVLISVVVASGIEPAARWFQKYKIPRVLAVILVFFIVFAVLGAMFYIVVPPIFSELSDLASNIPAYLDNPLESQTAKAFLPELPGSISTALSGLAASAQGMIGNVSSSFFQATATVFGGAFSFFLIIILSFYLAVQEKGIENFLRIITPIQHETYIIDLWLRSREKIGGWFKGQILLGVLVGVLVFLGLTILRAPYALTFALLAAVFELIPVFGATLAAIPAIGIAFLQSPSLALGVLVVYIIIQQFENHLIYPLVVRKTVGVPPIITILALVVGAKVGGFLGIILAVPVVAVLMEFLHDIERKKKAKTL